MAATAVLKKVSEGNDFYQIDIIILLIGLVPELVSLTTFFPHKNLFYFDDSNTRFLDIASTL